MSIFRVGQKVCCVDPHRRLKSDGSIIDRRSGLVAGETYTVVGITYSADCSYQGARGGWVLKLAETEPDPSWKGAVGFNANRFRPIVERKTSIELFKAMLNPSRVGEPA